MVPQGYGHTGAGREAGPAPGRWQDTRVGPAGAAVATVAGDPAPDVDVPEDDALERQWQRLTKADELVQAFAQRGWIADEARTVVESRTTDLARRVGRVQQRGGTVDDPGLAGEVAELTALLVALADAAVEAQPSLAPEEPVPVGIADAQRRRGSTQQAYDDLP